jgi:hypothetical protein
VLIFAREEESRSLGVGSLLVYLSGRGVRVGRKGFDIRGWPIAGPRLSFSGASRLGSSRKEAARADPLIRLTGKE